MSKTRRSWDVWSFGIVMCEVLFNDGMATYKLANSTAKVEAVREWASGIEDAHLRAVALWCLRAVPRDRAQMRQVYLHLNDTLPIDEVPSRDRSHAEEEISVVPQKSLGLDVATQYQVEDRLLPSQNSAEDVLHLTGEEKLADRTLTAPSTEVSRDVLNASSMSYGVATLLHMRSTVSWVSGIAATAATAASSVVLWLELLRWNRSQ